MNIDAVQITAGAPVLTRMRNRDKTFGGDILLATRPYQLSHAFAAAGRFQFMTIFHTGSAVKNLRLKKVEASLISTTAAINAWFQLMSLTSATTPATGNPAITLFNYDRATALEATVLALPTTQGTEGTLIASTGYINIPITTAPAAAAPVPDIQWRTLYEATSWREDDDPLMRAANAEGFSVTVDVSALATITGAIRIRVIEE